jgi:hypothetical protein
MTEKDTIPIRERSRMTQREHQSPDRSENAP